MKPDFNFHEVFDQDYLYFNEVGMTPERNDWETELIVGRLELRPGMRVLDVPCGHGRIANRLAAQGIHVTGLDSNPDFLDRARRDASDRGVSVEYVLGDMRELSWQERFDCVVNWFTSFGFFDDETDRRILTQFRRVLVPGGHLLIEHTNRDRFVRALQIDEPVRLGIIQRNHDLMIDRALFDPINSRADVERIIVRNGSLRRTHFSMRLFTFAELRGWLMDAGFRGAEAYDFDLPARAFRTDSKRLITVAWT